MSKSLEEELNVPQEATLMQLPAWSLETANASILISSDTSLRKEELPRCLLVGRQAATADIRIQHGSISRKHAILYYLDGKLVLQDLGGKHGTHVNGERLSGSASLKQGDTIYFGNARETNFSVCAPKEVKETMAESTTEDAKKETTQEEKVVEPGAGLTGRAKREAEIAAMMDSLDTTPSYQKYVAPKEVVTKPRVDSKAQKYSIPVSEHFDVSTDDDRKRVVTCLAVDAAGSRFSVGGTDTHLRMYDFAGMDQLRTGPFKTIEVEEGHLVVDVCYSNTGDRLLVATGSVQPKVLDRDGNEIIQFVRGDMYVTDQARTSGHTALVTGVDWHPLERDVVLTCGLDGSARLWNLNGKTQFHYLVCDKVYSPKSAKGRRVGVTAVAFHPGGREFVLGTACGSIQVWNATRVGARPEKVTYDSHGEGKPVNFLTYNVDGSQIASRSKEDTAVHVWDARRLARSSSPVVPCTGLPTVHERSNAAFSPDGRFLCAGTSEHSKGPDQEHVESGSLKVFLIRNVAGGSGSDKPGALLSEMRIATNVGVIMVKWHPKLNQIFAGCSDGRVCVYFDRSRSTRGAILATSRAGRPVDELSQLLASRAPTGSAGVTGEILTPNALPMFQDEEKETKRKREKARMDPVKSRKPEGPAAGIKAGSQGVAANLSQFVASSTMQKRNIAGKDPREELFKFSSDGKKIYTKGDQPVVLAETTVEEEEEKMMKSKKK